jgi:hypothetical protein
MMQHKIQNDLIQIIEKNFKEFETSYQNKQN